jgi:hypothetical protein
LSQPSIKTSLGWIRMEMVNSTNVNWIHSLKWVVPSICSNINWHCCSWKHSKIFQLRLRFLWYWKEGYTHSKRVYEIHRSWRRILKSKESIQTIWYQLKWHNWPRWDSCPYWHPTEEVNCFWALWFYITSRIGLGEILCHKSHWDATIIPPKLKWNWGQVSYHKSECDRADYDSQKLQVMADFTSQVGYTPFSPDIVLNFLWKIGPRHLFERFSWLFAYLPRLFLAGWNSPNAVSMKILDRFPFTS